MVTSLANRPWPGDVPISDPYAAGLPAPSVVRTAKIATIEARDTKPLGHLAPDDQSNVAQRLRATLKRVIKFGR